VVPSCSGSYSFGREPQNIVSRMANVLLCRQKVKMAINDGLELLKDDVNSFCISWCRDSPSLNKEIHEGIRNLINNFPKPVFLL